MFTVLCDVFRCINIVLSVGLVWMMPNVKVVAGTQTSESARALWGFVFCVIMVNAYGTTEKLIIHSKPATSVFLLTMVYLFGVKSLWNMRHGAASTGGKHRCER